MPKSASIYNCVTNADKPKIRMEFVARVIMGFCKVVRLIQGKDCLDNEANKQAKKIAGLNQEKDSVFNTIKGKFPQKKVLSRFIRFFDCGYNLKR